MHGSNEITSALFFFVFGIFLIIGLWKAINKAGQNYDVNTGKIYNIGTNTSQNTYLYKASPPRKPPQAVFFERINSEDSTIIGPEESKYLNSWEILEWKAQKRLNGLPKPDNPDEID